MNLLFFGSSAFSIPALLGLRSHITCVVTKKTKPKGRGYLLEDNEVKRTALSLGLPIREIGSFQDEEAARLGELKPDLIVVVSFGLIIPRWFLDLAAIGAINAHPSLLPKYRGPAPMQWAIWNGDDVTGITVIRLSERMDAGNILYQERAPLAPDEDASTLSSRLGSRVAEVLPPLVEDAAVRGIGQGTPQNDREATYTPIITKEMGRIDWNMSAAEIVRQVRALVLWPTAYAFLDRKTIKVFKAGPPRAASPEKLEPGRVLVVSPEGIEVSAGAGSVVLREIQMENRKRMAAADFAKGFRQLSANVFT
jgi:methionyl-tRNA formyltransferase